MANPSKSTTTRISKTAQTKTPPQSKTSVPRKARTKASPKTHTDISPDLRHQMIAEAAYLRAEQRCFGPGDPLDDWLVAEREIDMLLVERAMQMPQ